MSVELYQKYLVALEGMAYAGKPMLYEWSPLSRTLDVAWMPYSYMLDEFSVEIANSVNQLTNYAHRLKAWGVVTSSMTDQEKLDAACEFIDPIATVALTLPYVIRSRFIFATAHLCHQANRSRDARDWKDDLPLDDEIYFSAADAYGAGWSGYKLLKRRVERIGNKNYQTATCDFRNVYNHRFSPHVVIGISQIVKRQVEAHSKKVTYAFRCIPALTVKAVAELLNNQCKQSYGAFEAFQKLIGEHVRSIVGSAGVSSRA
jgi:hypothetical protein